MGKSISELLRNAELQNKENSLLLVQLQAKVAMMAAIVESADDAIISESMDGTITFWNPGSEKIFGYSAQEAVGQHISMIIPPEYFEQKKKAMREIGQGKIVQYDSVRRKKNGELFDVSITSSPMRDFSDNVIGYSNIERDISIQKENHKNLINLNEELEEANERFYKIFDFNPVAMILINFETGKIQNVNKFFIELFEFLKEEVMDKTAVELKIYGSETYERAIDLTTDHNHLKGIEGMVSKKNGEQFWGFVSATIIYIHRVKYLLSSFQDISYRKRNEQALAEKAIDVEQQNIGLENLNKELELKNKENQSITH